ncbi:uncharacterized protein LOC103519387 [Diaphorina citri]|uniref:Uncharacterized protein LOC103519387 n=1 Tax=Diaphorina citri TaxID=121845 RepID=A0A1S3DK71_DIACI|nr:uncharacterized protein LOC103519387 [Diaphorina citri]
MEQAKLASQNRSTKENELVLEKEADIDDFAETTKGRQNTLVKAIERRQSKSIKGNPARLETCPRISSAKETEEEYDKPNEMAHEFTHVDGSNIIDEPCDVDTKNMIDETSDIDRNAITNETPDDNDIIYESSDGPNDDDSSDGEFIDIERRQSKSIKGNPARLETCPRISSAKETEEKHDKPNETANNKVK